MKAVILTEGGRNIGFGHLARCLALCEAFKERKIRPEFVVNGDNSVRGFLKKNKFIILDWTKNKKRLSRIVRGCQILIIDSYLAGISFYRLLPEMAETVVYLDDNARLDYPEGIVINGNMHARELDYPRIPKLRYLLGPGYVLLRKPFWGIPEKKVSRQVKNIILTFGGDDQKNITPLVLKLLVSRFPRVKKTVVIGKAFKNTAGIKKEADSFTKFIYYPDAQEMKEAMLKADLAVSSGGQTLYELARAGLAVIGISVSADQEKNLKSLRKTGFLEFAARSFDRDLEKKLSRKMGIFLSFENRKKACFRGRRLVDGQGAREAVKNILSFSKFPRRDQDVKDQTD